MSSFTDAIGVGAAIKVLGREVQVGPIDLEIFAGLAAEMKRQIPNPLPEVAASLAGLPESLAKQIFSEVHAAYRAELDIGPERAIIWALNKPAGLAYLLWLLLERSYAGKFDRGALLVYLLELALASPLDYAELLKQIMEMSGLRALGESIAAAIRAANQKQKPTLESLIGEIPSIDSSSPSKQAAADSP